MNGARLGTDSAPSEGVRSTGGSLKSARLGDETPWLPKGAQYWRSRRRPSHDLVAPSTGDESAAYAAPEEGHGVPFGPIVVSAPLYPRSSRRFSSGDESAAYAAPEESHGVPSPLASSSTPRT